MALEPGNLNHLSGAGQTEWNAKIEGFFDDVIGNNHTEHLVKTATPAMNAIPDVVDWSATPVRAQTCLQSRDKAKELADWSSAAGDPGRGFCHEEYLEWRSVRDSSGKLSRFEASTETIDYWTTLARHDPSRVLELVGQFAGEVRAPADQVYGSVNPFAAGVSLDQREAGFRSMMLPQPSGPPLSPYNNGQKAISFMYNSVNTIEAAVVLAAYAAFPYAASSGGAARPLTGAEAIASTQQAAVDCRNSDPTIVGGVVGMSFAGRQLTLDDPIGLYMVKVDNSRLLQPWASDAPVPADWFTLSRGTASADGKPRSQRVTFQVPVETGKKISDLIDADTGENIEYGWQIAQLIRIGLYVRSTAAGVVAGGPVVVPLQQIVACSAAAGCAFFRNAYTQFEATRPTPIGGGLNAFAGPRPRLTRVQGGGPK